MQAKKRILAIDDNETNICIFEEMLEDEYILKTAMSGEEALEVIEDFAPDLVLLDIMMPGIDGYAVCRQIRENPALQHIKIIMVSAKSMVAERLLGYEMGADDYITKPFEEEELMAKIKVYLRLKSEEEVNQLKTDLLSLLCHETGTPLNSLISPAEILSSDDPVDDEMRKELGAMIYSAANKLHELFEKVTRLSAIKSGKYEFNMRETDAKTLTGEKCSRLEDYASSKDVQLETANMPEGKLLCDTEEVGFVIQTLIKNAVDNCPAGGKVSISAAIEDDKFSLTVNNPGKTISDRFLPRVFDEFAKDDVSHHQNGTGLSLAISKQIIKQHQGRIEVTSSEGEGTYFRFEIPLNINVPAGV